jgi:transposase
MWIPPEEKDPVLLHKPTRKSVGYFGAVRIADGKFLYQSEKEKFNGISFHSFLKKLRRASSRKGKKIVVITDNARYHHANLHKKWRGKYEKSFSLLFLPPYSPELNPIERVWKLTRRLCLHNIYFPTLSDVITGVENQFKNWHSGNEILRKLCAIN